MRTQGQRASRRQEDRVAKRVNGTRNAGSGSFWSRRSDVRSSDLLIECKWTAAKQITIKAHVLEKNFVEAVADGREPVLSLELNGRNYVIVLEDDYIETRERLASR